jgi:hypothetical protein
MARMTMMDCKGLWARTKVLDFTNPWRANSCGWHESLGSHSIVGRQRLQGAHIVMGVNRIWRASLGWSSKAARRAFGLRVCKWVMARMTMMGSKILVGFHRRLDALACRMASTNVAPPRTTM